MNNAKKDTLVYFGAKQIEAKPMTLGAYNEYRGWQIPDDENPQREGYLVIYPDGYQSWSPKEIFEDAYRLVTDTTAEVAIKIAMAEVEKLGTGKVVSDVQALLNNALIQINNRNNEGSNSNIPPHVERMIQEDKNLLENITKAMAFTQTEIFSTLSRTEQGLLVAQVAAMKLYRLYLVKRISNQGYMNFVCSGITDPQDVFTNDYGIRFIPIHSVSNDGVHQVDDFLYPIIFCKGNSQDESALRLPGIFTESIIAAAKSYLEEVNTGSLATRETSMTITKLDEALLWLNKRALDRKQRQVQGTYDK